MLLLTNNLHEHYPSVCDCALMLTQLFAWFMASAVHKSHIYVRSTVSLETPHACGHNFAWHMQRNAKISRNMYDTYNIKRPGVS